MGKGGSECVNLLIGEWPGGGYDDISFNIKMPSKYWSRMFYEVARELFLNGEFPVIIIVGFYSIIWSLSVRGCQKTA